MKTIFVTCPSCQEILEIDPASGAILGRSRQKSAAVTGSLTDRLKDLDEQKARREALVAQGKDREKTRLDRAEELFRKVREQGKEGPAERPVRDVDLD